MSDRADDCHDAIHTAAMKAWGERLATDGWAAFFSGYDPLTAARKVRTPVLLRLAAAIRSAGDKEG